MNWQLRIVCGLAFALLCLAGGQAASAQVNCGGYGGFGGWYGGGYNLYVDQRPPYFAMFPPVYYSYPVPRTYGYSPFAYPPGTMTPEITEVPATINNPYVTPKNEQPKGAPTPADKSSFRSTGLVLPNRVQVVVNPFVRAESGTLSQR